MQRTVGNQHVGRMLDEESGSADVIEMEPLVVTASPPEPSVIQMEPLVITASPTGEEEEASSGSGVIEMEPLVIAATPPGTDREPPSTPHGGADIESLPPESMQEASTEARAAREADRLRNEAVAERTEATTEAERAAVEEDAATDEPDEARGEAEEPDTEAAQAAQRDVEVEAGRPVVRAAPPPTRRRVGRGGGGGSAPELGAWQAAVRRGMDAINEPDMSAVVDLPRQAREAGREAAQELRDSSAEAPTEATEALPDAPAVTEMPEYSEADDPAPEATRSLDEASDRTLPNQTLPQLEESPGGHTPSLRRQPGLRGSGATFTVEVDGLPPSRGAAPPAPGPGTERVDLAGQARDALAAEPEGAPEPAPAGPIELAEEAPPEKPSITAGEQVDIKRVIAGLYVTVPHDAVEIISGARQGAYGGGILQREKPEFGNEDLLPGIRRDLQSELRGIASAAGVAEADLDAAVTARREHLEDEAGEVAGETDAAGSEAVVVTAAAGREATEAVDSALDWVQGWLDEQEGTALGQHDAQVVRNKRQRWIRRLRTKVAEQIANYRASLEKRVRLLNAARGAIGSAYRQAARADRDQYMLEAGPDSTARNRAAEQASTSDDWAARSIAGARRTIDGLIQAAGSTSEGFVSAIRTASENGTRAIREWAEDQLGTERSWLTELIQEVLDWVQQSRQSSDAWATRRRGQHVTDTARDLQMLRSINEGQLTQVELQRQLEAGQIEADQLAVIQTYFSAPPGSRSAIRAVAAGAKVRLVTQLMPDLLKSLRDKVRALPTSEWRFLDEIGRAQNPGFDSANIVSELYAAMHSGLTGWGTDEPRIFNALGGLTPEQASAVRGRYSHENQGRDLDEDLRSELSGTEEGRAEALLSGDPAVAAAASIRDAVEGAGTDEATIMTTLRSKTPAEMEAIRQSYYELTGRQLDDDLEDDLGGDDLRLAEAHLDGETDLADAIEIEQAMSGGWLFGAGTDEKAIGDVYERVRREVAEQARREGWDAERMEREVALRNRRIDERFGNQFADRYETDEGKNTLRAAFDAELSGSEETMMNALADNDQVTADAARLEDEFYSFNTDDDAVLAGLDRSQQRARLHAELDVNADLLPLKQKRAQGLPLTDEEQRRLDNDQAEIERRTDELGRQYFEAVRQDFNRMEGFDGALRLRIAFTTSGGDQKAAYARLEHQGRIPPELEIRYAIEDGDEDRVVRTFKQSNPEQIRQMRDRYDRQHGAGSFQALIDDNLEGRQRQDASHQLTNALDPPADSLEAIQREKERIRWELDEYTAPWAGGERTILQTRLADLERMERKLRELGSDADQATRNRLEEDIRLQMRATERGIEGYREGVDAGLDTITMAIGLTIGLYALAAAIVVTVAAYASGVGAPVGVLLTIGIASAVATLAATIGTKQLVLGDAYRSEDLKTDLAVGAVDIAISAATAGIGGKAVSLGKTGVQAGATAWRPVLRGAAVEGIKGAAEAAPSAALGLVLDDAVVQAENSLAIGMQGFAQEVAMSVVMDQVMSGVQGRLVDVGKAAVNRRRGAHVTAPESPPTRVTSAGEGAAPDPDAPIARRDPHGEPIPPDPPSDRAAEIEPRPPRTRRPEAEPHIADVAEIGAAAEAVQANALTERRRTGVDVDPEGLPGTPEQRTALWERYRGERPGATRDEFLAGLRDGSVPMERAAEAVTNLHRSMRAELTAPLSPADAAPFRDVEIRILSDAEFEARTGSTTGRAVTIIEDGQPRILVREGSPPHVLREEGIHLSQLADPRTRKMVLALDERRLAEWDQLSLDEQLALYRTKVELEIDAHRRLVGHLQQSADAEIPGPRRQALREQISAAERNLGILQRRASEVKAITPERRIEISAGRESRPEFLDQPSRLFQKTRDLTAEEVLATPRSVELLPEGAERARAQGLIDQLAAGDAESGARIIRAVDKLDDPLEVGRFYEALGRLSDQSSSPEEFTRLAASVGRLAERAPDASQLAPVLEVARRSGAPSEYVGGVAERVRLLRSKQSAGDFLGEIGQMALLPPLRLNAVLPMLERANVFGDPTVFLKKVRGLAETSLAPSQLRAVGDRVAGAGTDTPLSSSRANKYLSDLGGATERLRGQAFRVRGIVEASAGATDPVTVARNLRELVDANVPPSILEHIGQQARNRGASGVARYLEAAVHINRAIPDRRLRLDILSASRHVDNGVEFLSDAFDLTMRGGGYRDRESGYFGRPLHERQAGLEADTLRALMQRAQTDPRWASDVSRVARRLRDPTLTPEQRWNLFDRINQNIRGGQPPVRRTKSPKEQAADLIASWGAETQATFHDLTARAQAALGSDLQAVVPLEGMERTGRRFGDMISRDDEGQLFNLVEKMLKQQGKPHGESDVDGVLNRLLDHELVIIRGTTLLRSPDAPAVLKRATGVDASGEVHHFVPLYLGGTSRAENLLDLSPSLHRQFHEVFEELAVVGEGTTFSPWDIHSAADLRPGAAVVLKDGSMMFVEAQEFATADVTAAASRPAAGSPP